MDITYALKVKMIKILRVYVIKLLTGTLCHCFPYILQVMIQTPTSGATSYFLIPYINPLQATFTVEPKQVCLATALDYVVSLTRVTIGMSSSP